MRTFQYANLCMFLVQNDNDITVVDLIERGNNYGLDNRAQELLKHFKLKASRELVDMV